MKKIKYRQDKREMVTLTNGKKKNFKSLVVGDEFKDGIFNRKVVEPYYKDENTLCFPSGMYLNFNQTIKRKRGINGK